MKICRTLRHGFVNCEALKYRLSHGLLIPDALIAATAIIRDESFISKNQRDYRFINELKLLAYPIKSIKY
ncbi:PilT protein [Candidatus Magnetoovum chiemensis]|nr:PilT protein [Candidatus Magnetoovum chiemensis]